MFTHFGLFSPLARQRSAVSASLAGFFFSGLIHEIAISVPARGGYGLPTFYFLMQGVAVLWERWIDRSLVRLRGNARGWLWTLTWVLLPAPWLLFHRPFIEQIVLPIVSAVGSLA